MAEDIPGYIQDTFSAGGIAHPVYSKGTGAPVIILHELPGMVKACVGLANEIADAGFRVHLPLMFGEPNGEQATAKNLAALCISREFKLLASNESGPITTWLRALSRKVHAESGARGVGAIGMCLTGGFVISMMMSPELMAPVVCQPALPMLHITAAQRKALGVSPAELDTAVARGIPLLGYRFRDDKICPREKFDTLREKFGSRFEGHEIAGDKHAVLTISYDPSNPELRGARLRVIEFLRSQLQH